VWAGAGGKKGGLQVCGTRPNSRAALAWPPTPQAACHSLLTHMNAALPTATRACHQHVRRHSALQCNALTMGAFLSMSGTMTKRTRLPRMKMCSMCVTCRQPRNPIAAECSAAASYVTDCEASPSAHATVLRACKAPKQTEHR
jgi:hypothetical protein